MNAHGMLNTVARMPEGSVRRDGTGNAERAGRWLFAAMLAVWFALPATAAEPTTPRAALTAAERVLMLGDSITYAGGWVADVAAWMEYHGLAAEVIDCGLPSETVSGLSEEGHAGGQFPRPDLHERLDRVLRLVRPDLVLACYGMNCGIYKPLDETRFARFRDGIERLHAAVEQAGATIIHLTPPVYGGPPGKPGPAGDVDYDAAESHASMITPVPGGVGTVTTAILGKHTIQAAYLLNGLEMPE